MSIRSQSLTVVNFTMRILIRCSDRRVQKAPRAMHEVSPGFFIPSGPPLIRLKKSLHNIGSV